jgi:phosphatidylserine decarboxylase
MIEKFKAILIAMLPQHLISRLVYRISRCRVPFVKNNLIRLYMRLFDIDLQDARERNPYAYASWNAFFTRSLNDNARPVDQDDDSIVSPVDGTISQLGYLEQGSILQAKGHYYSVETLLGNTELGERFHNGAFITLYLSPRDYHRIHMPFTGKLERMLHVPGRLFSVAPHTVNNIEGIFARNERVVSLFGSTKGPMALSLIGAINVGAIETCWAGLVTPPAGKVLTDTAYGGEEAISIDKGLEMGRFNLGSTVILIFPKDTAQWIEPLQPGDRVLMGQKIGTFTSH